MQCRAVALLLAASAICAPGVLAQKSTGVTLSGRVLTQAALQSEGRAVVVVFDDLNDDTAAIEWAKQQWLDTVAHAPQGSAWAILTTSGAPPLPMTSDVSAVRAALGKIASHSETIDSTTATATNGRTGKMHAGGGADEVLENHSAHSIDEIKAAVAYAATLPGPPLLIVVSSGFPVNFPANGNTLDDAVTGMTEAVRAAGVLVNAVDPALLSPGTQITDWQLEEGVLNSLVQASGGKLVDSRNDLAHAFDHLSANPGLMTAGDRLRQALGGAKFDDIPMEVAPAPWVPSEQAPDGAHLIVRISPRGLDFEQRQGHNQQHVRVDAVLTDAQGTWIAAREGDIVLNLDRNALTKLNASGVAAGLELPALPGVYHLVIVGQELRTGKTTALATNLTLK